MDRIIPHFVRGNFWFEIECPKTAVTAADNIKLWIEVKNALTRHVNNAQVGVTGTQHATSGRMRKIAIQPRSCVEQLAQAVFKMTAHIVDAGYILNHAAWRVHSLDRLIAR